MESSQYEKRQRYFRRKCFRYIVLSLMLITVLVLTTSCAALLTGNNKKAYDLMVKAAEYFKYPSSVQISSGMVSDDSMFCVIRAKNSYGNYRSDSYYVSSSGYPSEYSSTFCYSSQLDCDLINQALASHFSGSSSSTNIFSNMIGGINMSPGATIAIYVVIIIVALCLNGLLASKASDIAQEKGYEKKTWFHMCFWLGIFAYVVVAAMPDKEMRLKQDKTIQLLQQLVDKQSTAPAPVQPSKKESKKQQPEDVSSFLPDL